MKIDCKLKKTRGIISDGKATA